VKQGETMYTISQLYAIKLSKLYAMNNIAPGTTIEAGTILQLRKAAKKSIPVKSQAAEGNGSNGEEEQIHIDLNLE
jgi:LysM repeat protein